MPSNYRPYYPRVYGQQNQPISYAPELAAGEKFGGGLISGIGQAIEQNKMNAVANQLMNTANPPRAALVSPGYAPAGSPDMSVDTDPEDTEAATGYTADQIDQTGTDQTAQPVPNVIPQGVSTTGTSPITGGVAEMKLREQFAQSQLAQAAAAAKLAGTGQYAARAKPVAQGVTATVGGSSSRWLAGAGGGQGPQAITKGAKPVAYQPLTGDVENDESTDNPMQIGADFDATYGQKGLYSKYLANISSLKPDAQGNFPLTDSKGNVIATVPGADAPRWQQRTNAARIKGGLQPLGPLGTAQNPTSTAAPGSQTNPVVVNSKLQVRSVPFGTWVYDPGSGQTYQKQQPPAQ